MTSRIVRARFLVPTLALLMVCALTVGSAAGADDSRVTVHRVTVPAAYFVPGNDNVDYDNIGLNLYVGSGSGVFNAPIPYFYDGADHVFITRVELLAYDNSPTDHLCLSLYRGEPGIASDTHMGQMCTPTSGLDPQSITFLTSPRRVNAGQRAYLQLWMSGPGGGQLQFYGARVTYTTNP